MHLMVAGRQDDTPRDLYTLANNGLAVDHPWWTAVLLRGSPFSPVCPVLAVQFCGDAYKSRFGEWEKAAADYPAVAVAFAHRAMAAARWEESERWFKLVSATGDIEAIQQLAKVYALQGKWDLWVGAMEDSLKAPDFGLSHAMANTSIARYYMHGKQWEKAMPYAAKAAHSYSEWGLRVLAECQEATHDWTAAEAIYKAMGERYPTVVADWYAFCRRTGQGDLASARRAFTKEVKPNRALNSPMGVAYYLLEKDLAKAKLVLQHRAGDGNPVYDLHLALLADQAHDNKNRDKILDRVKQKAANYQWAGSRQSYASLAALAGLIAGDLAKGGKGEIDLAAAERLSPPEPFEDDDVRPIPESKPAVAFAYLLGRYLDQHGKPELAQRCWKRCLAETDFVSDFNRTLAAAELLSRGIQVESEKSRPHEAEGQPKSPP